MYFLYLLGIRITPRGVDELPLIAIEVKNQQNQWNQQENKSIRTKHIVEGKRSLWRVLGYQKNPRHIRKVKRRGLLETKMGKTRDGGFKWKNHGATKLCRQETT